MGTASAFSPGRNMRALLTFLAVVLLVGSLGSCAPLSQFLDTDSWFSDAAQDRPQDRKIPLPPTVEEFEREE